MVLVVGGGEGVNCAFVSIIAVRSSLSAMVNNSFCMYYLVDFFSQILPQHDRSYQTNKHTYQPFE